MATFLKSDLLKILATIFLFLLVVGALLLVGFDKITGQVPDPLALLVLGAAVSATLPIVGVHQGVSLANGVSQTAVAASVEANKQSTAAAVEAGIRTIVATQGTVPTIKEKPDGS
jgi:hypothetical protein